MKLIDKDALVAEIERLKTIYNDDENIHHIAKYNILVNILSFLDTLEVKDPYEQCIQYSSVKDGIKAHAETYSFNIESELFPQLTKEQQALWRKEIEQDCISGGDAGYSLARDIRYKENVEVKEAGLDGDIRTYLTNHFNVYEDGVLQSKKSGLPLSTYDIIKVAEHFFELGLQVAQKGE